MRDFNSQVEPTAKVYEFGDFRLDAKQCVLLRRGEIVALQPKAFDALRLLVENNGRVVGKSELMRALWAEAFVEEVNLNRCISNVRHALGETAKNSVYIQTQPKRGFRFVGEVREVGETVVVEEKITRVETQIEIVEFDDSDDPPFQKWSPATATRAIENQRFQPRIEPTAQFFNFALRHRRMAIASAILFLCLFSATAFWLGKQSNAALVRQPKSIAVVPLKNLGGADDTDNFGLSTANALTARFGYLSDFKVRPLASVLRHVEKSADDAALARAMQADAVLTGSFERYDNRLRVTLQLVSADTGTALWTTEMNERAANWIVLQDELAERAAGAVRQNFKLPALIADAPPTRAANADAEHFYARGMFYWLKRTKFDKAIAYFQLALDKDPNFALAHCRLAELHAMTSIPNNNATENLTRARELAPDSAEVLATTGFIEMFHYRNWELAEKSLRRAIELDSNNVPARQWLANYLAARGRLDEAKAEMHRALEIDPTSPNLLADLGQIHYFAKEYDQAADYCRRALAQEPHFALANVYLSDIFFKQNKFDESFAVMIAEAEDKQTLQAIYAETGYQGWIQREIQMSSGRLQGPFRYAKAGDVGNTLFHLEEQAEKPTSFYSAFVAVDPLFENLHREPRFKAVLQKMKLDD